MKNRWLMFRRLILGILALWLTTTAVYATPAYTMTVRDGFISIWSHADNAWHLHTQIPIYQLPECDRQLLLQGLLLEDESALTCALEDFCS